MVFDARHVSHWISPSRPPLSLETWHARVYVRGRGGGLAFVSALSPGLGSQERKRLAMHESFRVSVGLFW